MHSTKTEILALLKRTDGATVDELSSALGLASMTVRQHLTALERDALVRAQEVRRTTGRPHFRYRLTEGGHRSIAEGYDRLLALLVTELGVLEPAELATSGEQGRRALLFRRAAISLARRHRGEIAALHGVEQVQRIVAVLRAHGGFAEWHEAEGGVELRDFGCVYRSNVGGDGACEWHEPFLSTILEAPVEPAPEPADACADCCRYIIAVPAGAPAASRGHP